MTVVLDASAVLAFLQDEPGAALVEEALVDGASCGAANWSELAQKVLGRGRDWDLVGALLDTYAVDVTPVVRADAEWAARRWLRGEGPVPRRPALSRVGRPSRHARPHG